MSSLDHIRPMKVRSVWISDIHLGFRGCSAEMLLDFLRRVECEYLYLVGDIIDVWNMKRGLYWPQQHNNVIRTLLGKAKHDTRVVFVPGNHDEVFRDHEGTVFGNVSIQAEAFHETRDGRRLLVMHGDEFDTVVKCSRWLAMLGSRVYDMLLALNHRLNGVRRRFGLGYWSLAGYLKHRVKNAVNYISSFEEAVAREARRREVDGVVCGHIHHAEIRSIDGVLYCNCGDWVESNTALVEHHNGDLELLHWSDYFGTATQAVAEPGLPRAVGSN
ncbi:MAG: UDP-2,3-diacylglucosamine diphosphatase [Pseudomonadota bacterium]